MAFDPIIYKELSKLKQNNIELKGLSVMPLSYQRVNKSFNLGSSSNFDEDNVIHNTMNGTYAGLSLTKKIKVLPFSDLIDQSRFNYFLSGFTDTATFGKKEPGKSLTFPSSMPNNLTAYLGSIYIRCYTDSMDATPGYYLVYNRTSNTTTSINIKNDNTYYNVVSTLKSNISDENSIKYYSSLPQFRDDQLPRKEIYFLFDTPINIEWYATVAVQGFNNIEDTQFFVDNYELKPFATSLNYYITGLNLK